MTESDKTIAQIKSMIDTAAAQIAAARTLLADLSPDDQNPAVATAAARLDPMVDDGPAGKIIEGIFDGQNMAGPDKKQYSVPANYASKSKLVEGDTLKLTITPDGSFVYKQIGPVERKRLVGMLVRDEETSEYRVVAGDSSYRILLASVTYFKGEAGDEVVVLVPSSGEAKWAAVENIIKKAE